MLSLVNGMKVLPVQAGVAHPAQRFAVPSMSSVELTDEQLKAFGEPKVRPLTPAGGAEPAPAPAATSSSLSVKADIAMPLSEAALARVAATPKSLQTGAMCSQMATAAIDRIARSTEEEGGCSPFGPPLTKPTGIGWDVSTQPKNKEELMAYAIKTGGPGYWDPLNIIKDDTPPETIGWWRHAEIKHGRVAMAAVVGYLAQTGFTKGFLSPFPWNIQGPLIQPFGWTPITQDLPAISFADIAAAGGPADQWDALPTAAKVQIGCVIGFLEMHGENSIALEADGQKHYVRGGKPGYYPSFKGRYPHPVPLDLWDPFGFTRNLSPERKEKALIAELNNGRLAMIGIFGLLSAAKGLQVPGLSGLVRSGNLPTYAGEVMMPFSASDALSGVPFVADMLEASPYLTVTPLGPFAS